MDSFNRRGRTVFHVEGQETEKAPEPTVESLVPVTRRQKQSGEYGRVRKITDSHSDKTEQSQIHAYSLQLLRPNIPSEPSNTQGR